MAAASAGLARWRLPLAWLLVLASALALGAEWWWAQRRQALSDRLAAELSGPQAAQAAGLQATTSPATPPATQSATQAGPQAGVQVDPPTAAPASAAQPARSAQPAQSTQPAQPAQADGEPPELRLARALALAAAGDERALAIYHALQQPPLDTARPDLAAAARYNAGNLLARRAQVLRDGPQPGQAIALIELAKQHWRAVLRANPDDWDARYNLERALRLQPEADDEEQPPEGARQAERAATTMRAFSPGLP